MSVIRIRGAREHNLQDIDVDIPRDKLVVITGLSGSGKSSLAFDTIYAEGQRRYVESLSSYARQFLQQKQKPDVDSIDGLSPAISIEQKSTSHNPRSTVGTLTEIYDYLRLLFARIGQPHCHQCGKPITSQTVQQIVDNILELPDGTKFVVLAPIVRGRKGEYKKELADFKRQGFLRVRIDGADYLLDEAPALDKQKKHDLDLVVDRLSIKPELKKRLTDSVELALGRAEGLVRIAPVGGQEVLYSQRFACHDCGISVGELVPRLFSFNSPHGACKSCDGLGHSMLIDVAKVIPDRTRALREAVRPWCGRFQSYYRQQLLCVAKHFGQDPDQPFEKLPKRFQQVVLGGTPEPIHFVFQSDESHFEFTKPFEGVIPQLTRRLKDSQSDKVRDELHTYVSRAPCDACQGARLSPEALAVTLRDHSIAAVCALSVREALGFFANLSLSTRDAAIAERVLKEVRERLLFLEAVGLDYLSLDRHSHTLSGGEAQRIRLATQIGSALRGVIYVLDEPSIGLHQRDNERLLATLKRLRDLGNTVLVVEHDEDTIRAADHIIDMGPGAGVHGGQVVVSGALDAVLSHAKSLTGAYLRRELAIEIPSRRRPGNGHRLRVRGACGNNLRHLDVDFPLGTFTCVSGVSGSGKSTLVNDTLYAGLARAVNGSELECAPCAGIDGMKAIDKVIDIDQSPIGRTPRSNPATYTGLFGPLRDLFAELPESRARGYKPGRYSFNVSGGRCEACEGDGLLRIEMHFLPDVFVTCEQCAGKRYNRETLEVLYKGKSIADVLAMTIDEASAFLGNLPHVARKLETLQAVGLGYVALGQSATTLSGGEAQRIKLSRELSKRPTGKTVYILDEPTTGLHFHDVAKLLSVLQRLVDSGNTVVVIEHNLDVIKCADHIIDLGPEGGVGGGRVLAQGTPEIIAAHPDSATGHFLTRVLETRQTRRSYRNGFSTTTPP